MRAIFVQIKCEMGQAYKVAREAADTIEQMSELYSTSGQYDLLGKFYLEPEQDIGLFVTEKIQTLPGVKDTYTLITFNAFGGGRTSSGFCVRRRSGRSPPVRRAPDPVTPTQVRAGSDRAESSCDTPRSSAHSPARTASGTRAR